MIRLALALLCFVVGALVLIFFSWNATHNITWLILGNAYGELAKAGAIAFAWLAVALLLCFPLIRRLVRKQRWVAAAVVTPLTLLVGVIAWAGGSTGAAIHECERAAFPLLECGDWQEEARKANIAYKPYWERRLSDFFAEPFPSLWDQFQIQMHDRHVAAGWIDATNPEHVRAVDNDWGRALAASQRGLLPDLASLGEP
jgi:hypothetical protein